MDNKIIKDTDKQQCMYTQHYRAIYQICWKAWNKGYGVDFEDLLQQAYLIIKLDLEPLYKADRGCSEVGYLFKYLPYRLWRYQKKYKLCDSLNKPLPDIEGLELMDTLQDESIDIEDSITNKVFNTQIKTTVTDELSTLPETEQTVLRLRYFQNKTLKETAQSIGVNSNERVRSLQARAERRLRSRTNLIKLKNEIIKTRAYRHVTLTEFKYTHTSVIEKALRIY